VLVACAAKYVVPLTAHDPQEPEAKMKYHLHQVTQYIILKRAVQQQAPEWRNVGKVPVGKRVDDSE
jgi:hypothetical protein